MTAPSPGGVQRWRCYYQSWDNYKHTAFEEHDPDGDWVRYGDIAGMASENERLRNELREARSELVAILGIRPDFDGEDMDDDSVVAEEYIACFQTAQSIAGRAVHYIDKKAEALSGAAGEVGNG